MSEPRSPHSPTPRADPREPSRTSAAPRSHSRPEFEDRFHRDERLAMFSDGVFAIVVTLLVLELKVPALRSPTDPGELVRAIGGMRHELVSFVLSFLFTVTLWVSHNVFHKLLVRVDPVILWVNNLFLLFVCFVPFPTAVIGTYPENPAAIVLFGLDWFVISIILFSMGRYALVRGLLSEHVDVARYREAVRTLGWLLPLGLVPMAVAYALPMLALAIYVLMALAGVVMSFRVKLAE